MLTQSDKDIAAIIDNFCMMKKKKLKTIIKNVITKDDVTHKIIMEKGTEYKKIAQNPKYTYQTYDFKLDTFQNIGICAVEQNESIVVSAQTACGKTLVGEYAIARALNTNGRGIYLTPLEILSKQKYNDFIKKFADVGLITENTVSNKNAKCLVMTTSAFRNVFCREKKKMEDVKWIVYDEIHYLTKEKNGVDCEESIMMLPPHARMVFLSATIANIIEFGVWICTLTKKPVHVTIAHNRVVPLEHYFLSNKMYLVENGELQEEHYWEIMKNALTTENADKEVVRLVEKVKTPAVFFARTAKHCFNYAKNLKKNYVNCIELQQIEEIVIKAMKQIENKSALKDLYPILKKGIGIHCDEMIPLARDLVQLLFEKSLIKIVFATNTFSVGLNMPVRTVVFTSLMKGSRNKKQILDSSEYIQMSGRAGRRGMESKGVAISVIRKDQPYVAPENLFCSCTSYLNSVFQLRYKMILDSLRNGINSELKYVVDNSFNTYQSDVQCLLIEQAIQKNIDIMKKLENIIKKNVNIKYEELYKMMLRRETLLQERNKRLIEHYENILSQGNCIVDLFIPRCGATLKVEGLDVKKYDDKHVTGFFMTKSGMKYLKFPAKYITDIYIKKELNDINTSLKRYDCVIIEENDSGDKIENESIISGTGISDTIDREILTDFSIYENDSSKNQYTIGHSAHHSNIYNGITLHDSEIKKYKNILEKELVEDVNELKIKEENKLDKSKTLINKLKNDNETYSQSREEIDSVNNLIKNLKNKILLEKKLQDIKMIENKSVNEIIFEKESENPIVSLSLMAKELKENLNLENVMKNNLKQEIGDDLIKLIYKDKIDNEISFLEKTLEKEFYDIHFDKCFFCNKEAFSCLVACDQKVCHNKIMTNTLRLCQLNCVKNRISILFKNLQKIKNNSNLDDLNHKVMVLRKLDYITETNALLQKGEAASEITITDPLLLVEIICDPLFNTLSFEKMGAFISCLIVSTSSTAENKSAIYSTFISTPSSTAENKSVKYLTSIDNLNIYFTFTDKSTKIYEEILYTVISKICNVTALSELKKTKFQCLRKFSFHICETIELWIGGSCSTSLFEDFSIIETKLLKTFLLYEKLLNQILKAVKILKNEKVEKNIEKIISIIRKDVLFVNLDIGD